MLQTKTTGSTYCFMERKHTEFYNIGLVPDFLMNPSEKCGVNVYSLSLISEINDLNPEYLFTLFIPEKHLNQIPKLNKNFRIVPVRSYYNRDLFNISWYFFILPYLAYKYRIDLLHLFSGNRRLTLFPFKKTLVTVHDIYHYYHKEIYTIPRYVFCKFFISTILKHHRNIIAVSRSTASDLERFLKIPKHHIQLVENGYDERRFRVFDNPNIREDIKRKYQIENPFMLYVSALDHPRKNHNRLIRAYELLKKKGNTLPELVFVGGDFCNTNRIYEEIEKYKLGEHVKIIGYVPDRDLAALYNMAEVFVHPSYLEGFGLPLLEAMACGLPVACSDIQAFRGVGGDVPVFFNPNDPKDIAAKLKMLLHNPILQDKCRQKGLDRVKRFAWKTTARKVVQIYNDILS